MDSLLQDIRYAARMIVKNPGFALLTILCLALGIGVNSTIFSVVDTLIIRPLPFRAPEELTLLFRTQPKRGIDRTGMSFAVLQDFKDRTHTFVDLAGESGRNLTLSDGDEPERLFGSLVTSNLFPLLGIDPMLGRQFRPDEDRPGAPRVAILSHGLWQRRFASDPTLVGRTMTIDGAPHTVIGVMPPRFRFPETSQLWVPQGPVLSSANRESDDLEVYARLKGGVTLDGARRDATAIAAALAAEYPEDRDKGASVLMLREDTTPSDVRLAVFTMMGAVTLVLLVACANVANLLLARATVRRREIAVRGALGAGRGRIVRQLLTESVILGGLSAPLGVLLAYLGLEWLTASIPPSVQMPYYWDWSLNPRVILYTSVVAAATGVIFGLAPAFHASRMDFHDSLKEGGRSASSRNRLRTALVVAEIALSLILLVGASLFIRSFLNLQHLETGLDVSRLMTMRFFMQGNRYEAPDALRRRAEDVVRRIEALPNVVSVMASSVVPLGGGRPLAGAVAEGTAIPTGQEPSVTYFAVTPHTLRTLDVALLAGRDFTDVEGTSRPDVAIVNVAFARVLWPGIADVVGRRFRLTNNPSNQWITVIGLIGDFRLFAEREAPPPRYALLSYAYVPPRNAALTIRVAGGPPATITGAARIQIRASDPTMPITQVRTGEELRLLRFWDDRLMAGMFSVFAAVALLLAAVGVYGVMSYGVSQRTQEIGVRMALGASPRQVLALVLGGAVRIAVAGIVCGVIGAVAVTRVVASLLYNVSVTDPVSFTGTALFLALVALMASYLPARRATAVDPMIALRTE